MKVFVIYTSIKQILKKERKFVLPCGTACVWCLGPRGNSSFAWRCECLVAEKTDQIPANQTHGAQTQKRSNTHTSISRGATEAWIVWNNILGNTE